MEQVHFLDMKFIDMFAAITVHRLIQVVMGELIKEEAAILTAVLVVILHTHLILSDARFIALIVVASPMQFQHVHVVIFLVAVGNGQSVLNVIVGHQLGESDKLEVLCVVMVFAVLTSLH